MDHGDSDGVFVGRFGNREKIQILDARLLADDLKVCFYEVFV